MAETDCTTQDLVRLARAGDREGFTRLYARLAPALHTWIDLRLSPSMRSRIEPEDLLQEVWWRALDALKTYDPERASFRMYMFTITKRVFISALRRASTVSRAGLQLAGGLGATSLPASVTDVGRRVARDQVLADVIRALRKLGETDQAIFVHCGLEGQSAGHAAALVGLSRDAVLKRWQRLRERLRVEVPEGERLVLDLD